MNANQKTLLGDIWMCRTCKRLRNRHWKAATSFVKRLHYAIRLCKHARSISCLCHMDIEREREYEMYERTNEWDESEKKWLFVSVRDERWLADILIIIVRLRVSLLYLFCYSNSTELFMGCSPNSQRHQLYESGICMNFCWFPFALPLSYRRFSPMLNHDTFESTAFHLPCSFVQRRWANLY